MQWTNEAFAKIYGYSFDEFIQNSEVNLIKNSTVPEIEEIINNCITEHKSVTYEAENKTKSGEKLWVQTTLTPIFNHANLTKIIAIESDITEIKKANTQLQKANIEISAQNKFIKSSINYAKTIQQAILPIQQIIDENLNNFIIYRPKDVVSGDFYWFTKIKNEKNEKSEKLRVKSEEFKKSKKLNTDGVLNSSLLTLNSSLLTLHFIAAVDCTGHGVPGAFMSMIANTLLNEIVNKEQIYSPKDILSKLNSEIRKSLKQDITANRDGMDLCLCRIEKKHHMSSNPTHSHLTHYKITFAGAKRSLFYYKSQEKELKRIRGSRKSIGGHIQNKKSKFINQEIISQKNDIIYLTTDGFVDQNNKERKRFGTKHFENILNQIATKPLHEQKQILETELNNWQGNEKQRDDITVVGIKL